MKKHSKLFMGGLLAGLLLIIFIHVTAYVVNKKAIGPDGVLKELPARHVKPSFPHIIFLSMQAEPEREKPVPAEDTRQWKAQRLAPAISPCCRG